MNIADIYAIGCLLVWGVSLGIVVAMLCMGRNKNAEKSGVSFNIAAIAWIVSILIPMNSAVGNPNYLAGMLAALTGLLFIAGLISWRGRLQKWGTVFAMIGTLILFFSFNISGFEAGDGRAKARQIQMVSVWKRAAQKDQNVYPAGRLDAQHPAVVANADVKWVTENHLRRIPKWHTAFTGLYQLRSMPPPEYRAGTLNDNLESIQAYVKSVNCVIPTIWRSVVDYGKWVVSGLFLFIVVLVCFLSIFNLSSKRRAFSAKFVMRPCLDDAAYLAECELNADSLEARIALTLRELIAAKAKIPKEMISGRCKWSEIYLLPGIDEFVFDGGGIVMALEEEFGFAISDKAAEKKLFDPSLAAYRDEKTILDFVHCIAEIVKMEDSEAKK